MYNEFSLLTNRGGEGFLIIHQVILILKLIVGGVIVGGLVGGFGYIY